LQFDVFGVEAPVSEKNIPDEYAAANDGTSTTDALTQPSKKRSKGARIGPPSLRRRSKESR
jgi:hypothetical protein